jgi:hypothetical protein
MRKYDAARREKKRQWRKEHPDKVAANKRRYYDAHRAERAAYDAARRRAWNAIVDCLICEDCGRPADHNGKIVCLDFHHRDPDTKLFGVARANVTWSKMLDEIAKCDILCRSCHKLRHYAMKRAARRQIGEV